MALEEFIIDLCEESVNGALLTFWLFQTYLRDLSNVPYSNAFRTCRRIYNRVQRIVFGASEPARKEKINDNVLPVTVLSSLVLASIAAPFLPAQAGPLAIAQARKPRPIEELITENVQTQRIQRSHTVSGESPRVRTQPATTGERGSRRGARPSANRSSVALDALGDSPSASRKTSRIHAPLAGYLDAKNVEASLSSSSLPDYKSPATATTLPRRSVPPPISLSESRRASEMSVQRRHSHVAKAVTPTTLSPRQKMRLLRTNYFRSQTQFLTALEDISNRLVAVPKPARLSALRAELALIAQDLPAEVDIPLICPATLENGKAGRSRHHRVVRLSPAEATSLNSAERVPYLLMLEVLREDFDFDPDSPQNMELITNMLAEKAKPKHRLFDITSSNRYAPVAAQPDPQHDSVFEPALGDLASPALLQEIEGEDMLSKRPKPGRTLTPVNGAGIRELPRLSSGVSTISSNGHGTPRTSDIPVSRSSSPGGRMLAQTMARTQSSDQTDFTALATHMRTASQMLAQLELSSAKRPKAEVAAIKAKIIASMQSLEEQSFYTEDASQTPSFETIMANANNIAAQAEPSDLEDHLSDTADPDPNLSSGAGAARMENDIKTGGVQRAGDRDDPSAATFGEAWTMKKERIRRSSPYGWMKNWDLVSVIVKTGADLRQEAFACQLIGVCSKIWTEANTDVWVKNMRILVTGESSGLIETITNGVSLHSLKRSLTLASIAAGTNPKKRIATLKDHFLKTFGAETSAPHISACENFARSLAAYSVISYVLQLKDRHNGNILIDDKGHIVHIDFGFMLSNSPGSMGFEAAPFKLTLEYVEVLGGVEAPHFRLFVERMKEAFQALRREAERIIVLVELMGRESRMPCYGGGLAAVVAALRARFVLDKSEKEAAVFVEELVAKSVGSYYTRL